LKKHEAGGMKRRIFFLLPDIEHTRAALNDLVQASISRSHMHVIASDDIDTRALPKSTLLQKKDGICRIEQFM
jgi:hypothetical protein